ncbi:MAG TPA: (2Fe-2S)-binding protein [bacterium]|nr:(2Fe-2S)-binding protein [bacterium]
MIKKKISFRLNGEFREFEIEPNEKLLELLRRIGYKGVKYGCLEGMCGSCTVIMNGKAIASCLLYAFQADGKEITTIEGVSAGFADGCNLPNEIQDEFIKEHALQCGYCTPGFIMSAKAMFDENPTPNDETIKIYTDGNRCRCTGYEKIWRALKSLSEKHREKLRR